MSSTDTLTILAAQTPLGKQWTQAGTIEAAASVAQFKPSAYDVGNIRDVGELLTHMQHPKSCKTALIRGAYVGDEKAAELLPALLAARVRRWERKGRQGPKPKLEHGYVPRVGALFEDQPLHMLMVDIDHYRPPVGIDPLAKPEAACLAYIAEVLPSCFHGCTFYWQLSGSAGHPSCAGILKAHVYVWLETSYSSAEIRAWALTLPQVGAVGKVGEAGYLAGTGIDPSVYHPVQLHFTAAPIFDEGVVDPVPAGHRSGLCVGQRDSVPLELDATLLAAAAARQEQQKAPREAGQHPGDKDGWHGAFCRVYGPGDLAQLLPHEFTESERDGRFDWLGHDAAGVFISDEGDGHCLVSNHATAPTGYRGVRNIFDFQRLHVFGHLDQGLADDDDDDGRGMTSRPSYLAMVEWIKANCPEVVEEFKKRQAEDRSKAEDDFDDAGGPSTPGGVHVGQPSAIAKRGGALNAALQALRSPEVCCARIALDRFTGRVMLAAPAIDPPSWIPLQDTDYTRLRATLERRGVKVAADEVRRAVALVAEEFSFDAAQQWLAAQVWDGVPRVDGFLSTYMGAADTPYTRAVSRYLLSAMAGRVLVPGVKADMVPIAVDTQGTQKSTLVESLAPNPEWAVTADLGVKDDDLRRRVQGRVVVELAELKGLKGKDAGAVKEFLSLRADTWVEKYNEKPSTRPRRFIFFGTTNRDDFLTDATGNRRFLPFRAGRCDPSKVRLDLGQLWAEGAAIFKAEGIAFAEAERLAILEHEDFTEEDGLRERIEDFVDGRLKDAVGFNDEEVEPTTALPLAATTVAQVMKAVGLGYGPSKLDRREQMRVADILRRMGWKKERETAGQRRTVWQRPPGGASKGHAQGGREDQPPV